MVLAQLPAHLREQRILNRQREIVDADARWIELSARPAHGNERLPLLHAPRNECRFGAHAVDRIHDIVEAAAKQRLEIRRLHEVLDEPYVARAVDEPDALGHCLDFRLAVIAVERMDLPVRIAFCNVVEIDERQAADRAARERFGHPGADAADADDGHVRALEGRQGGGAVKPRHTGEAPRAIGLIEIMVGRARGDKIRARRQGAGHDAWFSAKSGRENSYCARSARTAVPFEKTT